MHETTCMPHTQSVRTRHCRLALAKVVAVHICTCLLMKTLATARQAAPALAPPGAAGAGGKVRTCPPEPIPFTWADCGGLPTIV
jgi:hypothetical protein